MFQREARLITSIYLQLCTTYSVAVLSSGNSQVKEVLMSGWDAPSGALAHSWLYTLVYRVHLYIFQTALSVNTHC